MYHACSMAVTPLVNLQSWSIFCSSRNEHVSNRNKYNFDLCRYFTIVHTPRGQVCKMAACSVAVTITLLWTFSLLVMVPLLLFQEVDVVKLGGKFLSDSLHYYKGFHTTFFKFSNYIRNICGVKICFSPLKVFTILRSKYRET